MQLKKLEWQRLYPVKKLLFLGAWLFCVFIFVAAIILLVRDGNRENLWLGILCGIAAFVMSCPMIKYIRISYHCMPYFNRIFTKCELEELVKNEKFYPIENTMDKKVLGLLKSGTHWLYAGDRLISKDLAIFGWAEESSSLNGRAVTPVFFIYMTGEVIKIDLGFKIHIKEIENYNQYLWKKFQIIPRIIVGEQREHIVNAFARQFQELKENLGLNEKELVQTILRNPEKYRNMYMERLPDHIKKWCETNQTWSWFSSK